MDNDSQQPANVSLQIPVENKKSNMCCGVNTTHLKALVRKDFTNLNRRRCFCFLFLVFPPLISWAALSLFDEALDVENTTINGSLIMNLFQHQSFDMVMP